MNEPQWCQVEIDQTPNEDGMHGVRLVGPTGSKFLGLPRSEFDRIGVDPTKSINPMPLKGASGGYVAVHPDGRPWVEMTTGWWRSHGWHIPDPEPTAADARRALATWRDGKGVRAEDERIIEWALERAARKDGDR